MNIAIIGSPVAQYYERRPDILHDIQDKLYDLVGAGKLTPHIMKNWPFDDFMEALRVVEDRQVIGKVLLTI